MLQNHPRWRRAIGGEPTSQEVKRQWQESYQLLALVPVGSVIGGDSLSEHISPFGV